MKDQDEFNHIDGGWYFVKEGIYNNESKYYFEYGTEADFDLDVFITLTSYPKGLVSTENSNYTTQANADGSISFSNSCLLKPSIGKTTCAYMIDTDKPVQWAWSLSSNSQQ